jgi:hypothetical protein
MPFDRLLASAAVAIGAVACTPTLDWRELRPQDSKLRAMFPCKPTSHARDVALAGVTVSMSMFACSTAGTTYALAFADMKDPSLVTQALEELARAARAHLSVAATPPPLPLSVPGMTPNARASQWLLEGKLPDGRAVKERAAVFVRGTQVYQATMLGASLDAEAQETFFGALRVSP